MRFPLEQIESIPTAARARLAAESILDSDQLLAAATTSALRTRMATQSGISEDDLLRWAGVADLLRVKGIGPAYAQLLVSSGLVRNVQDLLLLFDAGRKQAERGAVSAAGRTRIARRPEVLAAAAEAVEKLKAFAQASGYRGGIPSASRLAEAAEEAAELRPRLIASSACSLQAFRQAVRQDEATSRKLSARNSFVLLSILTALSFGTLLLVLAVANVSLRLRASMAGPLEDLILGVGATERKYLLWNGSAMIGIVLVILIFLFLLLAISERFLAITFVTWFFRRPAHRDFYLRMLHLDETEKKRFLRAFALAFLAVAIVLFAHAFGILRSRPNLSTQEFLERFSSLATIAIPLAGTPPLFIYLRSLLQAAGQDRGVDSEASQRYLMYQLLQFVRIPLLLLLIAWLIPLGFRLWAGSAEYCLLPGLEQAMTEHRDGVAALVGTDVDPEIKEALLEHIEQEVLAAPAEWLVLTPALVDALTTTALPVAASMVAWMIIAAILALIVIPYLLFRGIPRGVFYALLLVIAFHLENLIQQKATLWFGLPPGSNVGPWLAAFLIFASALFFDWLYQSLTEPQATCSGCQVEIPASARYCSTCGLVQPEEE